MNALHDEVDGNGLGRSCRMIKLLVEAAAESWQCFKRTTMMTLQGDADKLR